MMKGLPSTGKPKRRSFFPCAACGKTFPTQQAMAGHSSTHGHSRSLSSLWTTRCTSRVLGASVASQGGTSTTAAGRRRLYLAFVLTYHLFPVVIIIKCLTTNYRGGRRPACSSYLASTRRRRRIRWWPM
jgi:ribosomal protein L37E